jgi:hypothetical protein
MFDRLRGGGMRQLDAAVMSCGKMCVLLCGGAYAIFVLSLHISTHDIKVTITYSSHYIVQHSKTSVRIDDCIF